jgi:predicted nucleic-acid-binding Zn-ribbon protein
MQESKKCPKCGNTMQIGKTGSQGAMLVRKQGDLFGDTIIPLYCQNCGYVEWWIENKLDTQK